MSSVTCFYFQAIYAAVIRAVESGAADMRQVYFGGLGNIDYRRTRFFFRAGDVFICNMLESGK